MKPYTCDEVEAELRAVMCAGDWVRVTQLAQALDQLTAPPRPVAVVGAALWYAEHRLPVFPIQPLSKVPYPGTRGCKDATTDPELITRWWSQHPGANVAIATGHRIDVIDFDGGHGHAAWTTELGASWSDAGVTLLGTVSTPRPGGLHVYVPSSGDGNYAGLLPGVDYRGKGGYVLAPPSELDNRPGQYPGTYRFLRPLQDTHGD